MKSNLETFDGKDNRREIMLLLQRLGSDTQRARFLESLIPSSVNGFAGYPINIQGSCDAVAAYFLLAGICNELGVPIERAAKLLERKVRLLK
jgi:hypothetical protein